MRDPDAWRFREYAEGHTNDSPVDLSGREGAPRIWTCNACGAEGSESEMDEHECQWVREGSGSLSILDGQGRHIAELKYEYWNGKQVVPWTEKEINEHGDRLIKAFNAHGKLVAALQAFVVAERDEMKLQLSRGESISASLGLAASRARRVLAEVQDAD